MASQSSGENVLFIRKLHIFKSEQEVGELFSGYTTQNITVKSENAWITMSNPNDCEDAIKRFKKPTDEGIFLHVALDKSSRSRNTSGNNSRKPTRSSGNVLFVRRLLPFDTKAEVETLFSKYKPKEIDVEKTDAWVMMNDPKDCTKAIDKLHRSTVDETVLYVQPDRSNHFDRVSGDSDPNAVGYDDRKAFVKVKGKSVMEETFGRIFSEYGPVEDVCVDTTATITMKDAGECTIAISDLNGSKREGIQMSVYKQRLAAAPVDSSARDGEFLDIDLDELASETYNPKTAQEPEVLGCYSVQADDPLDSKTAAGKYTLQGYSISDTSNLMDLNLTKCNAENGESDLSVYDEWVDIPPLDLTVGYEDRNRTEHQSKKLLFKFVERENLCDKLGTFVCSRRHLIHIAMSPYKLSERYDGNTIVVQKIGSVFFISSGETKASSKKKVKEKSELQKKRSFWGSNFETYVTAKPGESPDPGRRVDYDCHFYSVVTRNIGQHSVTVKGEVDCCLPRDRRHYLELKTVNRNGNEDILEQRKLEWWLQSYLLGVKDILCGRIDGQNKDEEGRVTKLKRFEVAKLESSLEEEAERRPRVCMDFLERFLTFVKENVKKDFLPYVFERGNGEKRFHMKPEDSENLEEYKFLPASFVNFYQKK